MNDTQKVIRTFALISQLGFSLLVPILACTFLGSWLEEKFSFPIFIPLVIMGVMAGIRNAWVLVRQIIHDPGDKKRRYWEDDK